MDLMFAFKILFVVLFGVFLGAMSMIPVGAVQIQVIKKALRGHLKAAITTALGSGTSDLLYGIFALFGFGKFMGQRSWQIGLYAAGVVVLICVLIKMYRDRNKITTEDNLPTPKYHGRLSYVSGFSIAITNPGMLVFWVFGYHFLYDLHMFDEFSAGIKLIFLISTCVGLTGYLIIVALAVYRLKKSFSEKTIRRINLCIFLVLSALVAYFIFRLVCVIFEIGGAGSSGLQGI